MSNGTMKVTVMYRNNWFGGDGWIAYPIQIEIADTCPVCGGKRGTPYWHRFHEDGQWIDVQKWDNPCGHVDSYKDCIVEFNKLQEGS